MSTKRIFVVADDDKLTVQSVRQMIKKVFPDAEVFSAYDGLKALELTIEHKPDFIISDIQMPRVNGYQLLTKIRGEQELKDIYFFIITANDSKDENIKALRMGADDFISKPISIDYFIGKLRAASRIIDMRHTIEQKDETIKELNEQLDEDIENMKLLLDQFQEFRFPTKKASIQRIIQASVWVGHSLGDLDKEEMLALKEAARLCFVGKLSLPDTMINHPVMANGIVANETMVKVPVYAKQMVSKIRKSKSIQKILFHMFENFDGSGIPEKIKSWQIPRGSRILRVAYDFEEQLERLNDNEFKAMENIYHEHKRLYDFRIVSLYDQYLANYPIRNATGKKMEKHVDLRGLMPGMILSRHITTDSALRLMSMGTVLKEEQIEKIREISESDPIIGEIYIRVKD